MKIWGGYSDDNLDPDENEYSDNNTDTEWTSLDDSDAELVFWYVLSQTWWTAKTQRNKYFVGKYGIKRGS